MMTPSEIEVVRKAHLAGTPCQIYNKDWVSSGWQNMVLTNSSYHWQSTYAGSQFEYRIKPETTKKETKMTTKAVSSDAPIPHKHATVIKAWADGKKIQYREYISEEWTDAELGTGSWLSWYEGYEYRIKPEPAKDFVKYVGVGYNLSDS